MTDGIVIYDYGDGTHSYCVKIYIYSVYSPPADFGINRSVTAAGSCIIQWEMCSTLSTNEVDDTYGHCMSIRNAAGTTLARVSFWNYLIYLNGVSTGQAITAATWYRLKCVVNLVTNSTSLYVNDVFVNSQACLSTSGPVKRLYLVNGWGTGSVPFKDMYVDNVVFTDTTPYPIPTWLDAVRTQYVEYGTLIMNTLPGNVVPYQVQTAIAGVCGWGNYTYNTSGDVYLYQAAAMTNTATAMLHRSVMAAPSMDFTTTQTPATNALIGFYDAASNYVGGYRWNNPSYNGITWSDRLISPAQADLDQEITADYSAGTLTDTQIITDLLNGASGVNTVLAKWIGVGTIAASSGYTNKFKFIKKTLDQCLRTVCLFNKRAWNLSWDASGNYQLNYDVMSTASGVTLNPANGNFGITTGNPIYLKRSYVTVKGSGTLTATVQLEANFAQQTFQFPEIIDQTTLNTMATNLSAFLNVTIQKYIGVYNSGTGAVVAVGKTVTLVSTAAPWNVTSATYYNFGADIDLLGNCGSYRLYSALTYLEFTEGAAITPAAAMSYAANLNATKATISMASSFPSSPNDDDLFWNTADEALYRYYAAGSSWIQVSGGTTNGTLNLAQGFMSASYTTTSTSYVIPTGLQASITPHSTSSKIRVSATISMQVQGDTGHGYALLYRDSTPIAQADAAGSRHQATFVVNNWGNNGCPAFSIVYYDSPSSTSTIVYSLKVCSSNGTTVYVNRSYRDNNASDYDGRSVSNIVVEEIMQ